MIVKKYIANTVEEAQKVISQDLGPTAVILTLRYVKQKGWRALFAANHVEVTAAIEEEELRRHTNSKLEKLDFDKDPKPTLELDDNLSDLKKLLEEKNAMPKKPQTEETGVTYKDPRFSSRTAEKETIRGYREPFTKTTQQGSSISKGTSSSQELSPEDQERALRKLEALRRTSPQRQVTKTTSQFEPKDFTKLKESLVERFGKETTLQTATDQLEALRMMVREEVGKAYHGESCSQESSSMSSEARFLMSKGVDRSIALAIEKKVKACSYTNDKTDMLKILKCELAELIMTTGPIKLMRGTPTVVAIVGPTGVGKTTTLVKIAAQYAQGLKKKVSVISLDNVKMGAREQIKGLATLVGCPLTVAANAFELQQAISMASDQDLILIDTAGQGQYRVQHIDALADILSVVDHVQTMLTVSATTKDLDAYGIVTRYASLNIDGLIFTKLDETIAHGIIVNVCQKTNKPVSYLTTGTKIPQDLIVADSDEIARAILIRNNAREFDQIRQLVTT